MAEYLRCPECDHEFRPPPRAMTGRHVRCPACDASVDRSNAEIEAELNDDDRYARRQSRRRKSTSSGSSAVKIVIAVLVVAGVLVVGCCGGGILLVREFFQPTKYPEQTEDFVEARKKFRTKLLKSGPAPQSWDKESPPPGVQEIEYRSGNLRLKAWIDQPKQPAMRKPAVLYLHGGFAFGEEDWDQAQPFRDAGFIVMTPILRGENGQPGNYTMFYDEVDDVIAAADFLAARPDVDANRIYVAGHSAGGTLTLLAAMASRRFRAAASFSGSTDQKSFVRGQEELMPFDPNDIREFQMRSPLAYPRSFKCPVRMYYGDEEILFDAATQKTAELANAAGLDVEAVEVPGDHFTSVDEAIRQAVAFFKQK